METIRGKTSFDMDRTQLDERLAGYKQVILDLGTGDGRYVHALADRYPSWFYVGVDTCRENFHEHSRAKLPNMLFVIASAQNLPCELGGRITSITINFPWGSLLQCLLDGDPNFMRGLESISCSTTSLDIRLNGGALNEAGIMLERGAAQIHENLSREGWQVSNPVAMSRRELQNLPATWARRLAVGRDPRAISLGARILRAETIELR